MREGWTYKKLGEVATYINGFPFKPSDWGLNGKPIIRIQNLTNPQNNYNRCTRTDIPEKYFVKKGDVLISWSATLGIFEWNLEDALLNQHIFKVVFDKIDIDKQYFKYAVNISISEMAKHTNGATMKHIRKGDFDNIKIPFPPLSEQKSIVSRLDSAFAHIDALKANAKKQLDDAKALFQKTMDKTLLDSGWKKYTLDDICLQITDGTHRTPKYTTQGIPFLSVKNITSGYIDMVNTKFISKEEHLEFIKRCHPQNGDILYTKVGTTGVAKVIDTKEDFSIFVSLALLKIKKDIVNNVFLEYVLNSPYVYQQSQKLTSGAANRNFLLNDIKKVNVFIPPLSEQQAIVSRLDQLSEKVKRLQETQEKTIKECDALKQAILREVFE